jgi:hypothetical protein
MLESGAVRRVPEQGDAGPGLGNVAQKSMGLDESCASFVDVALDRVSVAGDL